MCLWLKLVRFQHWKGQLEKIWNRSTIFCNLVDFQPSMVIFIWCCEKSVCITERPAFILTGFEKSFFSKKFNSSPSSRIIFCQLSYCSQKKLQIKWLLVTVTAFITKLLPLWFNLITESFVWGIDNAKIQCCTGYKLNKRRNLYA